MEESRREELFKLAKQYDEQYKAAGILPEQGVMQRESSMEHTAAGMDPWSQDPFDPFHGPGAAKQRRNPSQVPDSRMLFDIQRDLYNAAKAYQDKNYEEAERQTRNAARLIRRYIKTYVTHPQTHQEQPGGFNL